MRLGKRLLIAFAVVLLLALILFFVALPPLFDRNTNQVVAPAPVSVSDAARELHAKLWIADLHCDALLWNRDLLQRNGHGHVDVPRLLEGNVALQAFTTVSKVPWGLNFERNPSDSDAITLLAVAQRWPVRAWFSLLERALYQSEKLQRFAARSQGRLVWIRSKRDLVEYDVRRESDPEITAGFLGVEGAQVLEGELANVRVLFDAGVRMMAPTHFFDTEVGGSAHGMAKGGLTELGRRVIQEMEALGMLVDLAHASPRTIDDVLALATRPVVVSHTGVKGTCDNTRNLSDAHVRGIAATGGVIGIAFFPTAVCGDDVAAIVRAMRYTADLVGAKHVALGSDWDGAVTTPFDAAGLAQLTQGLLDAGFTPDEIRLVMGENVKRVLLETLP